MGDRLRMARYVQARLQWSERPQEIPVSDSPSGPDLAMTAKAYGVMAGIIPAYDFSSFELIADIGWGTRTSSPRHVRILRIDAPLLRTSRCVT
jgi:hypothetical protein